jgi:hypothetical protein
MGESNKKGDIGIAAVIAEASKKGYYVGIVLQQDCPYDLLIDRGKGKVERVQVKYKAIKNGTVDVQVKNNTCKNNNIEYSSENIDYFAIYVPDLDQIAYVPIGDYEGMYSVWLRVDPPKNNQTVHMLFGLNLERK